MMSSAVTSGHRRPVGAEATPASRRSISESSNGRSFWMKTSTLKPRGVDDVEGRPLADGLADRVGADVIVGPEAGDELRPPAGEAARRRGRRRGSAGDAVERAGQRAAERRTARPIASRAATTSRTTGRTLDRQITSAPPFWPGGDGPNMVGDQSSADLLGVARGCGADSPAPCSSRARPEFLPGGSATSAPATWRGMPRPARARPRAWCRKVASSAGAPRRWIVPPARLECREHPPARRPAPSRSRMLLRRGRTP